MQKPPCMLYSIRNQFRSRQRIKFLSRRKSNLSSTNSKNRPLLQDITFCSPSKYQPYSNVVVSPFSHLSGHTDAQSITNSNSNSNSNSMICRHHHSHARETLQTEKIKTINQIDGRMKLIPGNITRKQIEDEIQAAAMRMENVGSAEVGPSGNYEYYFHDSIIGSRSYRRRNLRSGAEQPVFSTNFQLEELGPMSLSVDEQFAARLITCTGKHRQMIVVTDMDKGIDFQMDIHIHTGGITRDGTTTLPIHNVEFGPTIHDGNDELHSLFFTTCDAKGRPNAVYGCIVFGNTFGDSDGKHNSRPELLLIDHEEANFVDVQRTKGCKYVAIHSTSKTSNEIHLVGKDLSPKLVRRRQAGIQYFLDCGVDDDVIIMAHATAMGTPQKEVQDGVLGYDFKVFEVKTDELPLGEHFGNQISANFGSTGTGDTSDYFIEDMDMFGSHICFYERSFLDGAQRIRVYNRKCRTADTFSSHEAYSVITPAGNINYLSSHFQFNVESPVKPPVSLTYDFDDITRSNASLVESKTHNNNPYACHRVLIDSHDGTKCPLTIVYNKSVKMTSTRPVVLVGYNCYGQNQNLLYDPIIMPLVDRGFAIVSKNGNCSCSCRHLN